MHESRGVQGLPEEDLANGYSVGDLVAIKNKPDFSLPSLFFYRNSIFLVSVSIMT